MAMIKTTKYFFWENPSLPGSELYGYLVYKNRIFKTMEVAKTDNQECPCVGLNVSDGLETEANFSGCRG